MARMSTLLVVAVFVGVVLGPRPAEADGFVVPWLAGNTGSASAGGLIDFGASVGATAAGVVDVDFDLGYSPDFFGNSLDSYVLTNMGNVTVGIPFEGMRAHGLRPYLTGGVGLIRMRVDDPLFRYSFARNMAGFDVGGGVTAFFSSHLGVRADLRHIRSFQDNTSSNPFDEFDRGTFHYWRSSIGLLIR
jgi:hypothetical protein